jgi:phytoene dehydrogenase-like protein
LKSLASPIGSLTDKLRVARLRRQSLRGTIEDRFRDPETTTLQALQDAGFSPRMIDRFFRPFLGGVFLDRDLQTSSRMLSFVFRMFSLGAACLPAGGMEAIPRQLAANLPKGAVRLGARVRRASPGVVTLADGEELRGKAVIVAADGPAALKLLGEAPSHETVSADGQGVTCLYFSAAKEPIAQPLLVLNGEGEGPINNLCVPTAVAPSYGPGDRSLVSVTVLGVVPDPNQLLAPVREQLFDWFGSAIHEWRHLRTYSIPYALPDQQAPALAVAQRPVRWRPGLYVCGDHRDNASIQGAMVSGRRTAETLLEDFS